MAGVTGVAELREEKRSNCVQRVKRMMQQKKSVCIGENFMMRGNSVQEEEEKTNLLGGEECGREMKFIKTCTGTQIPAPKKSAATMKICPLKCHPRIQRTPTMSRLVVQNTSL